VEGQAAERGIVIENGLAACHGVMVRGDPDRLCQVLGAILSNAIKFSHRGGRILVTCQSDPKWFHVRVADSGCGIPAARLNEVFQPFVQMETGRSEYAKQDGSGTGLGLAISRDLMLAMGGGLSAESTEGEGSAFTMSIARAT
jgi:signal transduction histidine kinase